MSKWQIVILFCAIIFLGAFFRFYAITEIPPGLYPDEAMNGNNALEALSTGNFKIFYPENNGREGLFINLQALSLAIFGNAPWALRLVSAIFGTLTIVGVYLLTRELFHKNFQFLIYNFQANSNDSIFKRLKIGNWKIENLNAEIIALLSSFFLATSFWHINFSRIGFRAIMVPFFATFGMYFLLKGLRRSSFLNIVLAGIIIGLGFHTYIAFRFMPFVIAVPLFLYFLKWKKKQILSCVPCFIALFLFVIFITALPIGFHFLQNPQDFLGRSEQVSIFSAESPLYEFAKSNVLTLGMFFVHGDCNGRHNFACDPELHLLVGLFFVIGLLPIQKIANIARNFQFLIYNFQANSNDSIFKRLKIGKLKHSLKIENWKIENATLLVWLAAMSLPTTLTREALPHALRSIGMIPPVMIFAGLGAYKSIALLAYWTEKQKEKWRENAHQLERIKKELIFLLLLLLIIIPLKTFRVYFIHWANNPNTYFAFSTDTLHLGQFLDTLPNETKKYVIVNRDGVYVRGIPMPAQTIMFATDTFREELRMQKNIVYVLPKDIETIAPPENKKAVIALLDGADRELIHALRKQFPNYKIHAPGDFTILETEEKEKERNLSN